jgi:hypothetical protein
VKKTFRLTAIGLAVLALGGVANAQLSPQLSQLSLEGDYAGGTNNTLFHIGGASVFIMGNSDNNPLTGEGVKIMSQGNADNANGAFIQTWGTDNLLRAGVGTNTISGSNNVITGTNTISGVTTINQSANSPTSINTGISTGNVTIGNSANTTTIQSSTNIVTGANNQMTATGANTITGGSNTMTATGANTINGASNAITATGGVNTINAATNTMTAGTENSIQGPSNKIGTIGASINAIGNAIAATTVSAKGGNARMEVANNSAALTVPSSATVSGSVVQNGVAVEPTQAMITGGQASPTRMTMTDQSARFSRVDNGAPVTVTGVADGRNDFDAINVRQFAAAIAAVSAQSNIPELTQNQETAIGVGLGGFMGKAALALGVNHRGESATFRLSIASGVEGGAKPVIGAGASWSF